MSARDKARQQMRWGYFRPAKGSPYVRCPGCREHVSADCHGLLREREIGRKLHDALVSHLEHDCGRDTPGIQAD